MHQRVRHLVGSRAHLALGSALLAVFLMGGCSLPTGTALPETLSGVLDAVATPLPTASAGSADAPADADESGEEESTVPEPAVTRDPTLEHRVLALPLAAPMNSPDQEFSAMAWHGERLVLVPQFPDRYDNNLYAIDRADILARIRGESSEPLPFTTIALNDGGLAATITGFEGYEAIAFDGDRVFLTAETRPGNWMLGYLVSGTVSEDGNQITLDPGQRAPIPAQAVLTNMTDESLIIDGDRIVTIYEANGANVNPDAVANLFSRDVEKLDPIPLTNLDYRITDATALDDQRRFWAINYFWPGDEKLEPANPEALAARFGQGASHTTTDQVERLVEFQIDDDEILLSDTPPMQLNLLPAGVARNWEGIVRLQDGDVDGFLLVTDKFPVTILGYVGRE